MQITTELIAKFIPCKQRFENWKKHYGKKKFTLREFSELSNITHEDKVWVLFRQLSEDHKVVFALDMALSAYRYGFVEYASSGADQSYYDNPANAALRAAIDATYAAEAAYLAAAPPEAYSQSAAFSILLHFAYLQKRTEEKEQLQILIYLIESQEKK